jgi:hypothetical protein
LQTSLAIDVSKLQLVEAAVCGLRKERSMKARFLGLMASVILGSTLVAAQATTPPQTQPKTQVPEVTLVGCIVQGSAPTIFILENAKKDPANPNEKGMTYFLVAAAEDLTFRPHLNHEVRLTGTLEQRTPPIPPPGEKVPEKDLIKFSAKSATMVADRCAP